MTCGDFGDHLAVIGRRAEQLRLERNDRHRLVLERLGEIGGLDLGPFRHADLIEAIARMMVVRPRRLEEIVDVLGVAQVREIGRGDDQDLVGADQRLLGPAGPLMRHVEHDARHRRAQRIEDRLERIGAEIVDPVERRRRRQQIEMIGAFGEQPIDEGGVDAVGRKHRFGDALRRVLIEIEAGRAEGEIEIGHDRIEREVVGDREGDIVGDGGSADAAFGADHGDDAADRLGVRRREQSADRAHDLQHVDR